MGPLKSIEDAREAGRNIGIGFGVCREFRFALSGNRHPFLAFALSLHRVVRLVH